MTRGIAAIPVIAGEETAGERFAGAAGTFTIGVSFAEAVSTGWAWAFHCGNTACEDDIKAHTAATPRCVPLDTDTDTEYAACVRCGTTSACSKRVVSGRAY